MGAYKKQYQNSAAYRGWIMDIEAPRPVDAVGHVVAIGASAGGLEALEAVFDRLPIATDAAYIVITHLSPDFKSLMDELLGRRTAMPVHVVEDGEALRPNRVYVIPSGKDMIMQSGRLLLTDRTAHASPSLPIDLFFGSLARDCGARAVAVVLSGTGSDGAKGVRALHDAGACVIAQAPETARFDGMPRAAIETGVVDMVLAPEAVGPALAARFARDAAAPAEPPLVETGDAKIVTRILELVLGGANVDFAEYKKTTVLRRIGRRMHHAGLSTLGDYCAALERNPAEARALAQDLLIVVTEFFRDPEAFGLIATEVMPALLAASTDDRPIRIWVPAVATGQEAYALAMLLREAADAAGREPRVQIFATDINPAALERAAQGVYAEAEMTGVSAARRDAFFTRTPEGSWQVAPLIRNWIVFAPHNMLRDPPFINTDLISCRNALIYFEVSAQQKLLSLFHFSLASGGYLLLGPSESIGEDPGRFATIDARWRLFRKTADRAHSGVVGEMIARNRWIAGNAGRRRAAAAGGARTAGNAALEAVLDICAPPGLLVGRDRELLHVIGAGRDYLDAPQSGAFTVDVVKLVRKPLRVALATGIERAMRTGEEVAYAATGSEVAFRVHPIGGGPDRSPERLFIAFAAGGEGNPAAAIESVNFDRLAEARITHLEDALRMERENLQTMLEQLETSNEELQSTNEELMTANEELQSTNEELHSVNEELYTVNAEYERKNEELTQLSKDVSGLLQATGVGVVFVDRALTVRRFTATATRVVNLIKGDEGRNLGHITHRLGGFDLCGWIETAMASGETVEVERRADDRGVWTVRAVPVKDSRGVSGAVVSLIDVTRVARAEAETRLRSAELRQLMGWVGAVSLQFSAEGRLLRGSGDWEAFTGQGFEALRDDDGERWLEMAHPDDAPRVAAAWRDAHERCDRFRVRARLRRPEGGWRPVVIEGGPDAEDGQVHGWFVYVRDAAAEAGATLDAAQSAERASALAGIAFAGAYTQHPALSGIDIDARLARLLGLPAGMNDLSAFEARMSPPSVSQRRAAIARRDEEGGRWRVDVTVDTADGPVRFRDEGVSLQVGREQEAALVGAFTPIEAREAEAALAQEILRSSPVEVVLIDPATFAIERANGAALRNLGYAARDLTRLDYVSLLPEYDAAGFAGLVAPLRAGSVAEVEVRTFALRRDGSTYDLALTLRMLAGAGLIAAVGRDATERRRIEEALRRRTEALARSNADLEQFAFLASHDLVEPLGRIAARARSLGAVVAGHPTAAGELAAIGDLATRLRAQVSDLLAFARAAPHDAAFAPVDMKVVAAAAVEAKAEAVAQAGALVEIAELPQVEGAAPMLQLVLENLVENALRYRAADRRAHVRIHAPENAPSTVAVSDNGIGFDPARAAEIFAPAVRLDPRSPGTGMGLAICRRVMEAHGGEITADGRPGEGATFSLAFARPS